MGELVLAAARKYHRLKEQETKLLEHWPHLDEAGTTAVGVLEKELKVAALELAAAVEAQLIAEGAF